MLRKLIVNRRTVPVPVPLKTLGQVFEWIGETLVSSGHTITRLSLNGEDIEYTDKRAATPITKDDVLDIRIDSPVDLAIQALEAVSNLSTVVMRGLRPLAVRAWEASGPKVPDPLSSIHEDIELIAELMAHFDGLVLHKDLNTKAFCGMLADMTTITQALTLARSNSDWRGYARVLLNRVEPLLQDLSAESESLESLLLAMRVEGKFAQAQ